MGGGSSKKKKDPPPPPPPKTPCESKGDSACKNVSNGKGCSNKDKHNFICKCADGYIQKYDNEYSECQLDDKCLYQNGGCDWHATCTNRVGKSPICACKAPYWEDAGGSGPGKKCRAVDMCGKDHGGCDKHANCIARTGRTPLCKCIDGYKGGSSPGDKCLDVDECADEENPPCGPTEKHGICTNTEGSYECKCEKGFRGTGFLGDCTQIPFCTEKNDCDPVFATCQLTTGSYECRCKAGLEGDGTVGFCKVPSGGDSKVYCEILGISCNEYQDCKPVKEDPAKYQCVTKGKSKQLSTFFSEGPSPNTPTWVWGVVAIGSLICVLIVGYLIYYLYKRNKRKSYDEMAEEAMYTGAGAEYGAVGASAGYT